MHSASLYLVTGNGKFLFLLGKVPFFWGAIGSGINFVIIVIPCSENYYFMGRIWSGGETG